MLRAKIGKDNPGVVFFCCEGWDRTSDLRVMSPTSYRCSTSRYGCKCTAKSIIFKTIFTALPLQDYHEIRICKYHWKTECR